MSLPLSSSTAILPAPIEGEPVRTRSLQYARRMSCMKVSAVREILKVTEQPEIISFAGGLPAPELFPVAAIAQAHADVFADEGAPAVQYSTTEGWRLLREWVAHRVSLRGIETNPDCVLITAGSQQGIDLVGKIFIDPGDTVIVENPCYLAALQVFNSYEAKFIAVDSDHDGMRVDQVEQALKHSRAKLIYLVPDFQNPKGTTLASERREQLIELSRRYEIPILEDDPYSELRYMGERPAPLAALDQDGLVIHLSTFSKTLSPGLRIGWATSSNEIIQEMVIAKQTADLQTSTVAQRAVARLLKTFDYDGHIATLCKVYGERCMTMRRAIEEYFPEEIYWTRPEGGLFLWVELPKEVSAEAVLQDALTERVAFVPGTSFFANEPQFNFMRLNFSNQQPEMIEEGIKRIAKVLKRRLA
jgi:2-aminoadipate transaminase